VNNEDGDGGDAAVDEQGADDEEAARGTEVEDDDEEEVVVEADEAHQEAEAEVPMPRGRHASRFSSRASRGVDPSRTPAAEAQESSRPRRTSMADASRPSTIGGGAVESSRGQGSKAGRSQGSAFRKRGRADKEAAEAEEEAAGADEDAEEEEEGAEAAPPPKANGIQGGAQSAKRRKAASSGSDGEAEAKAVETALDEAKKAVQEGDSDKINAAIDKLTQASHKLAEVMYKSPAGDGARRLIYVTDAGQASHFAAVFAVARRAGWVPEGARIEHVPFGLVQGDDGKKLKTRSGDTVRLKDLLEEAVQRAEADLRARGATDVVVAGDLIGRMWPPRWSVLDKLWLPLWDTLNMATLGTALGVVLGVPVAFLAARTTTPSVMIVRPIALLVIVARYPVRPS
jgi:hypothetical protein